MTTTTMRRAEQISDGLRKKAEAEGIDDPGYRLGMCESMLAEATVELERVAEMAERLMTLCREMDPEFDAEDAAAAVVGAWGFLESIPE